jgi:hypothetical protein
VFELEQGGIEFGAAARTGNRHGGHYDTPGHRLATGRGFGAR